MLMPRPFYSRAWTKRAGQHVDNAARKFFSAFIKAVDGTEQWVSLGSFKEQYGELLDRLGAMGVGVVACSCVYIDERLFPGTPEEYLAFNDVIRRHASQRGIPYVDIVVNRWPTNIHSNFSWMHRYKFFFLSCQCIVDFHFSFSLLIASEF